VIPYTKEYTPDTNALKFWLLVNGKPPDPSLRRRITAAITHHEADI
jgi:hypothetical protein